jgi:tetratricopeptide (TPR) repeat protein
LALGDYEESLKDAKRCIELDPNFFKGYYRSAFNYFLMDDFESALKMIEESNSKEPDIISLKDIILNKIQEETQVSTSKIYI